MEPAYPEFSLFPLGTVLFPDGPLALRIFEPRYLDMVSACLRDDEPFGVCLIRSGREVGSAAAPFEIGTLARIVDWQRNDDGVLGVTALGARRLRVHETRVQPDQLLRGRCETLEEPEVALPGGDADLRDLVERLLAQAGSLYTHAPARREDAAWVGYRLDELRRILRAVELAQARQSSGSSGDP